ncbi:hypothetical protein [Phenylobacterium sp.]|jgi:hypothetical protein|nr:hypothetical protein [Phenylobacterium sp.]MCA3720479.1 hypothetical protein [Phenylobacterium sp.]
MGMTVGMSAQFSPPDIPFAVIADMSWKEMREVIHRLIERRSRTPY